MKFLLEPEEMRELLLDAIRGTGFKDSAMAQAYEKAGMATFTGDQQNESWGWVMPILMSKSTEQLLGLYKAIR
jgi:hypothetical protein